MYGLLLLLAAGLFGAIAWRSRPLALALLAAALPTYLLRFPLGGIPTTLLECLLLVLVGAWTLRGEWKRVRSLSRPWLAAAGALLAAAVVATLTSADRHAGVGILKAYFVEPVLLFLVAATTLKDSADRERVLHGLGLGAAFASLVGVLQFATSLGIPAPWDVERRVTGPFPYPNALGLYAGPLAVLGIVRAWQEQDRRARGFWIVVAILCLAGTALAQSEAALAAILGSLFLVSLGSRRIRRWSIPVAAALAALAFALPAIRGPLIEKMTFRDYSLQVRVGQWTETWEMLKERPVFGAGLGGYPTAFAPYHARQQDEIFQYPHTLLFNVWSELGLAGIGALAFLAGAAARAAWRARHEPVALACAAALTHTVIHGLADVPYFKNDLSILTWILLALIATASYGERTPVRRVV